MKALGIRRVTRDLNTLERLLQLPLGCQFLVSAHPTKESAEATARWRAHYILRAIDTTLAQLREEVVRQGGYRACCSLARIAQVSEKLMTGTNPAVRMEEWVSVLRECRPALTSDELSVSVVALRIEILRHLTSAATRW